MKTITLIISALIGWALCGAIIGIGRTIVTLETTLIVHVVGAPLIFNVISWIYFSKFNYTSPQLTAIIFVSIVIFMDIVVIALFVEKSFGMFNSILGTWIPFALIYLSTYLTGKVITKNVNPI